MLRTSRTTSWLCSILRRPVGLYSRLIMGILDISTYDPQASPVNIPTFSLICLPLKSLFPTQSLSLDSGTVVYVIIQEKHLVFTLPPLFSTPAPSPVLSTSTDMTLIQVPTITYLKNEVKVSLSCVHLCNPMDYSPPGYSVHEILQARILEWVAISFSKESSKPRDQTWVSCIAGRLITIMGSDGKKSLI